LELGAGHGRLAFHILKHLEKLVLSLEMELPPYCYILSDIVAENLTFFHKHPQLQEFYQKGHLDLSYFDAIDSKEIFLLHAEKQIRPLELEQPILVLANYFFDSIPNDLFHIQNGKISTCSVALRTKENPENLKAESLIKNMEFVYQKTELEKSFYEDDTLNEILVDYKKLFSNTHLFFPKKGLECLMNIKNLSKEGMMLISMDKGFHEIHDLEKKGEPDFITHGSFSLWVNFHAFGAFCDKQNGISLFPTFSNFHLDVACLLFVETLACHKDVIDNFGPDDFNSIKKIAYGNISRLGITELIALSRLSRYDSTFFIKLFPRLKQVAKMITLNERRRLEQTLHQVWDMYFNINEKQDLAYEIAGMFYDLGFYPQALDYFQFSVDYYGEKADIYYNKMLCYYQLRQDELFYSTLSIAKDKFPDESIFDNLSNLDMTSA